MGKKSKINKRGCSFIRQMRVRKFCVKLFLTKSQNPHNTGTFCTEQFKILACAYFLFYQKPKSNQGVILILDWPPRQIQETFTIQARLNAQFVYAYFKVNSSKFESFQPCHTVFQGLRSRKAKITKTPQFLAKKIR